MSNIVEIKSPPCVKEGGTRSVTGGLSKQINNPSVSYADSSLYTREPLKGLHLNLMSRNVGFFEGKYEIWVNLME